MSPLFMTLLLGGALGVFAWSAMRRWRLLCVGGPEPRWDRLGERLRATWRFAFAQERMRRYWWAGIAHNLIFLGFIVLLLRSLILFSRGYVPNSGLILLREGAWLGNAYSLLKDAFVLLVILGTLVFFYYRLVAKLPRMTLSTEGLVILGIIFAMMVADVLYDGAAVARGPGAGTLKPWEPLGSLMASVLHGADPAVLAFLSHLGFWTHVTLVLVFLNLLPYSKHFHIITAVPNVFFQSLDPPGRLKPIADIEGKVERGETLGIKRIGEFSWKSILDFYTCTECGRCSDHCPATKTGKKLSPKHFTIDLRNFLYRHEKALVTDAGRRVGIAHLADASPAVGGAHPTASRDPESRSDDAHGVPLPEGQGAVTSDAESSSSPTNGSSVHVKDLVDGVIDPEVLWACTSCRACEQECPVFITYVDKIVDMRRYLVQERGEFPNELQTAFRGLESNQNPWGFAPSDRANWADGLDVPLITDKPDAEILFWVGCAPSYDDRAKKTARATAQLLKQAGVNFAILGSQEQCTGDPARRAGNEFLYQAFAQANCETLNGCGVKKIVTTCPHCFNTLRNEYPDFGGRYEVIHHTEFLADLVRTGRLTPRHRADATVVYHDSCYLGRYNEVYDAPREVLKAIPGLRLVEPSATRDRGMCCGAGGAQMFKEEEHGTQRVNIARTEQLLATDAHVVASACPFCMRMLTDGLASKERADVQQLDVAEMLLQSIQGS